ncbi:13542_t:CDS:2 [Gigaspora margarita]|uniref:13542_t:CDS:1 n=1 Tax=Gigaspora margarita TaxID=4874 RepID=A0ABM8W002_GIGMA|nr:13542_t:CDS:2 [Gigaspora margarita]
MAKTYNLYFGEGKDQVKYYTPPTPAKELQDFIDDPDTFIQYEKDQKDALALVVGERDALAKERDELKDKYEKQLDANTKLLKFLKDEVGYNNMDDLRTALGGEKLPDILIDANTAIKTLKANEGKLKKDIAYLQNQLAGMVGRNELKKAVEDKDKAVKEKGNIQNLYDPLNVANLKELDAKIKQLDINNKARLALVGKYGVDNLTKLDEYINKVQGERDEEKQKITDTKEAFERVVDKINKRKTVIIGDLMKTNIRLDLNRIKGTLGYDDLVKGDWRIARIASDTIGKKQLKTTRGGVQEVRFYLVDDATKEEIWGGQGDKPEHVKDVNWIGDRFVIFRNNKTGSGMLGADFDKQCEDLDDFYASINKGRGIKLADIKYDVYYDQEGGKQREQL